MGCSSVSAHAAPQSRIKAAISDSDRATIRETISGRAKRATDLGEAASDRVLSAVTLHFSLTDSQQADLTQLLADQQNPSSPSYHKWLTPQQYGARFGLSSADLAKVQAWLTGKGLKIVEVPAGQNYIVASGSLPQVESAFNTRIHSFSENGERHISNVTDPVLPSAIATVVAGVTGLNDFTPRTRAVMRPRYTASISNTTYHFLAPGDFHTIYNINPLLQQGINGTGIKIAIAGQTDISLSDVAAFRTAAGLPANAPQVVQVPNQYISGTRSTGDLGEAHLDVEWAGAVAPNATILFVTVGANQNAGVFDALNYAVSSNQAPIISVSYGGCESSWSQSDVATLNLIFQQANAQGITIVGPSGDSGATDCDVAGLASEGLAVDFPASSPFVTGAGGTMFTADTSDPGTYWNSSNSGTSNGQYTSSAKQYIPEGPWNETTSASGLDAGGAGGGGVSGIFSKPAWQTGLGVPNDGARDVPDISLAAAANHDGYLICEQGSCTNNSFNPSNSSNSGVVGGTSAASPAFAGMLALLEQKLGTGGLGNVNPTLYGLANTVANVFHDITSGNISVPCIQGTPNCPNGGSTGYSAGTGYDLASGLGSIDANSMVTNWTSA
ncbi:MAG TPA: S53 family peptidase, partial [Edaphobacter sp.]